VKKGAKTSFIPAEVSILTTENEWTAFEFKAIKYNYSQQLVINGAYDILSTFLLKAEE
jgi:hypothetical protein